MKKLLLVICSLSIFLFACGKKVDVKEMYKVSNQEAAQQDTLNVEVETSKKYSEADLKKIIIDISSQYDHSKVNGIRFNIIDKESNQGYAEAKIAFNDTGINATGVKKKNVSEINIK